MKNSYSSILSYLGNMAEPLDEELNQPSEVEKNMLKKPAQQLEVNGSNIMAHYDL